jgi:anti-sigma factor RsiW
MPDASPENHAAAAWVEGRMDAVQRKEFEAHLATCPECQAETAALLTVQIAQTQKRPVLVMPPPAEPEPETKTSPRNAQRRVALIVIAALVVLIVGFALGWSVWQMTDH